MSLIKFLILLFILCNIPGFTVAYISSGLGSLTSYLTSLSLIAFYVISKEKHKLPIPFLFLGILYFMLSGLNYTDPDPDNYFLKEFIRFIILIVCSTEVLYRSSKLEIFTFLLIGAVSIIVHALIFPNVFYGFDANYGRFSGFYINPNYAGSICLVGYAISYAIKTKKLRIIGQFIFTLAGILTFSRTFMLIWFLVTLIAIYYNKKNLIVPVIGVLLLFIITFFSDGLSLNTQRFNAIESILTGSQVKTKALEEDSRTATWAIYTDMIMEKPLLGNGYLALQKVYQGHVGVHNSYLMILGESGFIPFLIIIGIYFHLLTKSYLVFKQSPEYFYLSFVLTILLSVNHGYFFNYYSVFVSMYIYIKLKEYSVSNEQDNQKTNTLYN